MLDAFCLFVYQEYANGQVASVTWQSQNTDKSIFNPQGKAFFILNICETGSYRQLVHVQHRILFNYFI
jgi:hypothetical protein